MAVYDQANTNVHDLKEVNDTLSSISERLRFYFKSLSIEDNFSPEMYLRYKTTEDLISAVELAAEGLVSTYDDLKTNTTSQIAVMYDGISLKVSKGDITNQLNLETDALKISGNRLEISGENITLDSNNNLTIKGEVTATAGKIAGWTIGEKKLTGTDMSKITCDSVTTTNDIALKDIEVNGDSDFHGCEAEFQGTNLETDMSTIFLNGFTGENLDAYGDVIAGATRSYEDMDVTGQVTCKKCVTKADGKTWSDERLKRDIHSITEEEADEFVKDLKAYRYRFKQNSEISCGFMAQDIQLTEDKMKDYGLVRKGKNMSLSYVGIIPFLIKTIQRQTREIDELSGTRKP